MEKNSIIIVTGIPRSGTSMMLGLLQAGGMEVLYDENYRKADTHNPSGYFEYPKTRTLAKDGSWIIEAQNKALKVVLRNICNLPVNQVYKVILMRRNYNEIYSSQKIAFKKVIHESYAIKENEYNRQIFIGKKWLNEHHIPFIEVNYGDVIANPKQKAKDVQTFLESSLDMKKMIASVNPELYKSKS